MKLKKIGLIILLIIIVIGVVTLAVTASNKNKNIDTGKKKVVVSNFTCYDFIKQITKDTDDVELTFLLGPGKDAHSYDPTAQDLIKIQNADLFVYIGGEIEAWSEKVLEALNNKNQKVICIADDVQKIEEKEVDGAEEHEEHEEEEEGAFDEHIWTSPANAISMVNSLEKAMEEINPQNKDIYKTNSENYIAKIKEVDNKIQEIVNNKKRSRLVFGDKMPMQYFVEYYKLDVSAAFNGCSTESEPSSKTVAYLVNKVKNEKIPVVLYTELSTGIVANTIAKEAGNGVKAMQIQSLHNVTKTDFDNGQTWVDLMERNIDVLKTALQ
ncbi:MAG: zinc ABC transporter substrate-binding protein [Clostridiaceae bacterium]|nr:zinc ABC transporter substrate-binding protein [Clostridiaceae bacterium]